ncbi:MAG: hypothetical protein CW338_02805 [Clostridiales bacterium]|jgi:hypothetical protein|nr:hypothetical protein [Clostridiales bacterium]
MKKVLRVVSIVLLVMILTCSVAMAEGPSKAQMKTLETMVKAANKSIKSAVKIAQKTPYNDVPWLLAYVDGVAFGVKVYAKSIGATVVCDYEYYVIDGQRVAVDPLRVINPTKTKTGH